MTATRIPAPGFSDPVRDAQQTFRAALDALARPTLPQRIEVTLTAPGALTSAAGALVLALADDSTPVWLDPALAADRDVVGWIAFHTGAPIVTDPGAATFAVVHSSLAVPALSTFAQGSDVAPNTSATLIAVVPDGTATIPVTADGPGFPDPAPWEAPVTADFLARWSENHAAFPSGVDVFFAGVDLVTGLPRTTELRGA